MRNRAHTVMSRLITCKDDLGEDKIFPFWVCQWRKSFFLFFLPVFFETFVTHTVSSALHPSPSLPLLSLLLTLPHSSPLLPSPVIALIPHLHSLLQSVSLSLCFYFSRLCVPDKRFDLQPSSLLCYSPKSKLDRDPFQGSPQPLDFVANSFP